jgi:hypothetical protein
MGVYAVVIGSVTGLKTGSGSVATVTLPEGVTSADLDLELSSVYTANNIGWADFYLSSDAEGVYLNGSIPGWDEYPTGTYLAVTYRLVFGNQVTPTYTDTTWPT